GLPVPSSLTPAASSRSHRHRPSSRTTATANPSTGPSTVIRPPYTDVAPDGRRDVVVEHATIDSMTGPTELPSLPDARFAGLLNEAKALQQTTVALRRAIHRHPEVGLQLPRTQQAVLDALDGLPVETTLGTTTTSRSEEHTSELQSR